MSLKKTFKQFVSNVVETYKDKTRITPNSAGVLIRSFHISSPPLFILALLLATQSICNYIILLLLSAGGVFFIMDGCFVTIIEQELCNDTFTMFDPVLELLEIEKTNANNLRISYKCCFWYLFLVFLIYIYRFKNIF